jgi:hypothetical protein
MRAFSRSGRGRFPRMLAPTSTSGSRSRIGGRPIATAATATPSSCGCPRRVETRMITFRALRPSLRVPLICLWAASIFMLFRVGIAVVMKSAQSQPSAVFKSSLSTLAEWINQTGQSTVIPGPIAHLIGFPVIDLPVRQREFQGSDELTHVCSVPQHGENAVLLALVDKKTGDTTIWRGNVLGELVSAASFTDDAARPIEVSGALTAFAAEKAYIAQQMRMRSFRTGPEPGSLASNPPHPLDASDSTIPEAWRNTALPPKLVLFLIHPWLLPLTVLALTLAVFRGGRSP